MNRTYTPELAPDVLGRLTSYAGPLRGHFKHPKQAAYCGAYLQELLLDGERKSIEPMARRVHLPDGVKVADLDQALQQFLGRSPWDEAAVVATYRATMARRFASPRGAFIADDTGPPKRGKHPVGVSHQYCGALGKRANCQVAASLHYAGPEGHFPLAMRLYLPKTWVGDTERLDRAGVPAEARSLRTKGRIILDLLDLVRSEGLAVRVMVADAGYGVPGEFRDGLAERGMHYVVGVTEEMVDFQAEPRWDAPPAGEPGRKGRPATRSKLSGDSARPMSLKGLAAQLPRCKVTWREGTKGRVWARFAWARVWPAGGWAAGECRGARPRWLLVEEQADGTIRYAVSNLPGRTSRIKAVRLWKTRWRVEQGTRGGRGAGSTTTPAW